MTKSGSSLSMIHTCVYHTRAHAHLSPAFPLTAMTLLIIMSYHAGTIKLVVKYSPKVLEEMEFRFENTKSFRRGKAASSRR